MADQLVHRGPDSSGLWVDKEAGVGLAHRRLSIIDLSPRGHQPMISESGRFIITFNGEIYNYRSVRASLAARDHRFRGQSDTEVIVASIEEWGIKGAISRFNGMFAIAVWDRRTRRLYLVRDRLGEKPLYYGKIGRAFAFASELKALKCHPQWEGKIDHDALYLFMMRGNVPAPLTIYRGITKVRPGSIVTVDFSGGEFEIFEDAYWSMEEVVYRGEADIMTVPEEDMISGLDDALRDSIKQQMVADVPLGAFLSGGIDSSTVVAIMQSMSLRPVKTFSVGFDYADFDEARFARRVANHLGTDHTELYVGADEAINVVPKLPLIYDEPFADSSQIPTYLVSQMARRHVTVSLSGDAGDELFCGYSHYFLVNDMWKRMAWMPSILRRRAADLLLSVPVEQLDTLFRCFGPLFSKYSRPGRVGDKVRKAALLLYADNKDEFYSTLTSSWVGAAGILQNQEGVQQRGVADTLPDSVTSTNFLSRMMYMDTVSYLPDDILVKVDRASMAHSLECRIPFLDYRIVEYAWRLPLTVKYRDGQGKWVLRQVLSKYLPRNLFERPKMGFGVPIGRWLVGPLREWAEEFLDEQRLLQEGYLNPSLVRHKWSEHLAGTRNWTAELWNVLMFEAWLERDADAKIADTGETVRCG